MAASKVKIKIPTKAVLLVLFGAGFFASGLFFDSGWEGVKGIFGGRQNLLNSDRDEEKQRPFEKGEIKMLFVGDIMLDRGVEYMIAKYGEGDFNFAFARSKDALEEADILFGNLECPVSDKGYDTGKAYSFCCDPKAADALKEAGFGVLSVANNHTFDYTRAAFDDTLGRLKDAGIAYTGGGLDEEDANSAKVITAKGNRVAFLAFSAFTLPLWQAREKISGCAEYNEQNIKKSVESARQNADIVVVSFHFGEEYQKDPSFKQQKTARLAIDAGADLVVGHHPHVVQPFEEYKGKYIAYSLGNFIFDQYFSKDTMEGAVLEISAKNGKITEAKIKKAEINNFYQPRIID